MTSGRWVSFGKLGDIEQELAQDLQSLTKFTEGSRNLTKTHENRRGSTEIAENPPNLPKFNEDSE